jgi:hypothetical protein
LSHLTSQSNVITVDIELNAQASNTARLLDQFNTSLAGKYFTAECIVEANVLAIALHDERSRAEQVPQVALVFTLHDAHPMLM